MTRVMKDNMKLIINYFSYFNTISPFLHDEYVCWNVNESHTAEAQMKLLNLWMAVLHV